MHMTRLVIVHALEEDVITQFICETGRQPRASHLIATNSQIVMMSNQFIVNIPH